MKIYENEEEKDQLLLYLCYNCYFFRRNFWILVRHRCEKIFQKYYFNQKIQPNVWAWLTSKKAIFCCFLGSISAKLFTISFDWNNIFENFFHSNDGLRFKNFFWRNKSYSINREEVDFFLLHFSSSYSLIFKFFKLSNYSTLDCLSNEY